MTALRRHLSSNSSTDFRLTLRGVRSSGGGGGSRAPLEAVLTLDGICGGFLNSAVSKVLALIGFFIASVWEEGGTPAGATTGTGVGILLDALKCKEACSSHSSLRRSFRSSSKSTKPMTFRSALCRTEVKGSLLGRIDELNNIPATDDLWDALGVSSDPLAEDDFLFRLGKYLLLLDCSGVAALAASSKSLGLRLGWRSAIVNNTFLLFRGSYDDRRYLLDEKGIYRLHNQHF